LAGAETERAQSGITCGSYQVTCLRSCRRTSAQSRGGRAHDTWRKMSHNKCRPTRPAAFVLASAGVDLTYYSWLNLPVGHMVRPAERLGALGGTERGVAVVRGAVGVLDGAQPGGDGLAVGPAV
jgi:hypothetical protein